jgi:hypothetical protein
MADSKSLLGGIVLSMISCWFGASFQLSLLAIVAPLRSCNSRKGFASEPLSGREGPMARKSTFFGCVPVTMSPPMRTLSFVPTCNRVEMLPKVVGVGMGKANT